MIFDKCFAIVVDTEGALSTTPHDPGNWTGGHVGTGELRGTKWGISAASYPSLDIAGLTIDQAKDIYRRDFWARAACDQMNPRLALITFDAAVNSGVWRAVHWLQEALGIEDDGRIGPRTLQALHDQASRTDELCGECLARRIVFDTSLPVWPRNSLGWSRRVSRLPFQAFGIAEEAR